MRLGKLNNSELNNILSKLKNVNTEVICGSALGEDCAAIKTDDLILITTDPITGCTQNIGKLAIDVCVNDIASSGGTPFACLVTLLACPDENIENIQLIMEEISNYASSLSIDVIGGHTEYTDAVNRTILSITMIGKTKKFISSFDFKQGDRIIVCGNIAKEGTNILLKEHTNELSDIDVDEYQQGIKDTSDLSVLAVGKALLNTKSHISMHDITEGGLFGSLAEICNSANLGAVIELEKIPMLDITAKICGILKLNPYRLISSGSMLIVCQDADEVMSILKKNDFVCSDIGYITNNQRVIAKNGDRIIELTTEADELFKLAEGK